MNELQHHKEVTTWIKRKYPELIFRTDYAAGLKMTPGQAKTHHKMQSGKGYPDLFIAHCSEVYGGLFIELKTPQSNIILKDGSLSTQKHIQDQSKILERLREEGYAATFALGHQQAKKIIESYMSNHWIAPLEFREKVQRSIHRADDNLVF